MMDYFSPTFAVVLTEYIKPTKINFLCIVFTQNKTSPVYLLGPKTGVNIVCTFKIADKLDLSIVSNIICEIKI